MEERFLDDLVLLVARGLEPSRDFSPTGEAELEETLYRADKPRVLWRDL